jgi:hypothetical protein
VVMGVVWPEIDLAISASVSPPDWSLISTKQDLVP